ncbi:protein-disulfide isomerase [Pseudonocardiaceae bacterium YIM PH 21723]|nr:protein-disulfide isomerase [Pseudonocardiaceae bacterium YIM PH 21723]
MWTALFEGLTNVGGNAQKRKTATSAARAVSAARGTKGSGGDKGKVIGAIVVIVVLVGAIGIGLWFAKQQSDKKTTEAIPVVNTSLSVPAKRNDDGSITVGKEDAKVQVEAYEDFLCPACGSFEKLYGEEITKGLADGKLKVKYYMLDYLHNSSNPAGYSLDAAAASLCTVDSGKFLDYHASLYGKQPEELGPGYTKDQLISLGERLGIDKNALATCVNGDKYKDVVTKYTEASLNDKALQKNPDGTDAINPKTGQPTFKGTPTISSGGKIQDYQKDQDWLKKLLG